MNTWLERIAQFWCANMHGSPMWPNRGHYQCRVCHREYPVRFETPGDGANAGRDALQLHFHVKGPALP